MNRIRNISLTNLSGVVILASLVYMYCFFKPWNNPEKILREDVYGYYAYLPATFIHNDIKLERLEEFGGVVWHSTTDDGKKYIKYSCGMAILYSPFFLGAHLAAQFMDVEANGYTYPYKLALVIAVLSYLMLAFVCLSKFLRQYFIDRTVALVMLVLFVGTNLWFYSVHDLAYSHAYSFSLISIFLYCTSKWLETKNFKWAIWVGLSSGLFVLVRPIDIVFILVIPLLGVNNLNELRNRFSLFWDHKLQLLLMVTCFVIPILPQLFYNYHIFESIINYSYAEEGFFFDKPKIFKSLFSYCNGWLVYTPAMLFAMIGLVLLFTSGKKFRLLIWICAPLYIYIIASWWCWWYVGFGNRAYINLLPLLSIPLAVCVSAILDRGTIWRIGFCAIILLLIGLNLFQTHQFYHNYIHWTGMTKETYWGSFLSLKRRQLFYEQLREPDYQKAMSGIEAYLEPRREIKFERHYSFDEKKLLQKSAADYIQSETTYRGEGALHFPDSTKYCYYQKVSLKDLTNLYVTAWVKNHENFTIALAGEEGSNFFRNSNQVAKSDGDWDLIHLNAFFLDNITIDTANLFIWNQDAKEFWMDEFTIKGYTLSFESVDR